MTNLRDTAIELLENHPRPIAHMWSQVHEDRFGLVLGAGISVDRKGPPNVCNFVSLEQPKIPRQHCFCTHPHPFSSPLRDSFPQAIESAQNHMALFLSGGVHGCGSDGQ